MGLSSSGRAAPRALPFGVLVLLLTMMFVGVTIEFLPAGLLPFLARGLGVSVARAGLLVSSFSLVVALTSLPLLALTWRFSRKRLLVVSLAGYAASSGLLVIAGHYWVAVLARLLGGLSHALFFAIAASYVAGLVSPDWVGRAIGLVWTGTALALVVGVPLGATAGSTLGWRMPFAVLGGLAAAAALVAGRRLPDVETQRPPRVTVRQPQFRPHALLLVGATTVLIMVGQFAVYTFISRLALDQGIPERWLGLVLLLFGLTAVGGTASAGLVVDRRPRAGLLATLTLLTVAMVGLASGRSSPVAAALFLAIWGLAFGALNTLLNTAAVRAAPAVPDIAAATATTAFNLGISAGALVGVEVVAGVGPAALPVIAGGVTAVATAVVAVVRRSVFSA